MGDCDKYIPQTCGEDSLQDDDSGPTQRLCNLVKEPWVYTITRLLLQERAPQLQKICSIYGLKAPVEGFEKARPHWSSCVARNIYEPALLRIVTDLLEAKACVDGRPADDGGCTPLMYCAREG